MESREELEQLKTKIARLEADNQRAWFMLRAYFTDKKPQGIRLNKKAWITILAGLTVNILSAVFKILPVDIFY